MMTQNVYFLTNVDLFISSLNFSSEEMLKQLVIYLGSAYLWDEGKEM